MKILNKILFIVGLSSRENDRIISEFESKLSEHMKLLYAIDMLDEGIHVDGISGSFMLKPLVQVI